jgi:hypothetical protein
MGRAQVAQLWRRVLVGWLCPGESLGSLSERRQARCEGDLIRVALCRWARPVGPEEVKTKRSWCGLSARGFVAKTSQKQPICKHEGEYQA